MQRAGGILFAAALLAAASLARADEPPARTIRYADDALTVRLVNVPLAEVLAEVGKQSGAHIRGAVREPREVSVEFDAVPLPEALHRLLGEQNFALVYGKAGRLRTVKLLGGPSDAPPPAATAASPSTAVKKLISLGATLSLRPAVPVSGQLATALNATSAPLTTLVTMGLADRNPGVRFEAVRAMIQAVESDPETRAAVIGATGTGEEEEIASLLLGMPEGEDFLVHAVTQATDPELRARLQSLLVKLREAHAAKPAGG